MKNERNVQARKSQDKPLGRSGGSSTKSTFSTKLRGSEGPLTPYLEHLVSPVGDDEKMSLDLPGDQRVPTT